jgi:hypothetical protein
MFKNIIDSEFIEVRLQRLLIFFIIEMYPANFTKCLSVFDCFFLTKFLEDAESSVIALKSFLELALISKLIPFFSIIIDLFNWN